MKPVKVYQEVLVTADFLENRDDLILNIEKGGNVFRVELEHPVLGEVLEVFQQSSDADGDLRLLGIYPQDMCDTEEDISTVKSYYNDFLLRGSETYLEYYRPDWKWFLFSRNFRQTGDYGFDERRIRVKMPS